jgi:hypothetical protein
MYPKHKTCIYDRKSHMGFCTPGVATRHTLALTLYRAITGPEVGTHGVGPSRRDREGPGPGPAPGRKGPKSHSDEMRIVKVLTQ